MLTNIFAWGQALALTHPFLAMLLFPLSTFIVTFLFSAHSEEDYARLPAPLAHFVRFCAAFSASAPAILDFLAKLFGKTGSLALLVMGAGLWRLFGALASATIFVVGLAWCVGGCKDPQTVANIETGLLGVEQMACVILQSELGQNDPAIVVDICKIDPKLIDQVIHLFTAHKKAKAALKARASADGGPK